MSEYSKTIGGSLKLKGVGNAGKKIKKKKKSSRKEVENIEKGIDQDIPSEEFIYIHRTEAEKKFEEKQRERQLAKISKIAEKSHKEKVEDFNKKLDSLTEHFDIPKVGPG